MEGVTLKAFVPVSVRDESQRMALGNKVSGIMVDLPVGVAEPVDRVHAISAQTRHLKESGQAVGAEEADDPGARHAAPEVAALVEVVPETTELRALCSLVREYQDRADECFWQVWSASRHYRELARVALADEGDPANAAVDALVAFGHALGRFVERRHGRGTIFEFLSGAARADFGADPWLPPGRSPVGRIAIVSFHGARGRQWHTVVVAGCLDAWIPKGRRAQGLFDPFSLEIEEAADREVEAIADDRRTFYVAATRASARTLFTVSPGPSGRGQPSRFLLELAGEAPVNGQAQDLPPLTFPGTGGGSGRREPCPWPSAGTSERRTRG